MSMDYAQIVEGCRRRDAKAQRALYDEMAPMAMGVCMRYAKSRADAQDIMQDGFVKSIGPCSRRRAMFLS